MVGNKGTKSPKRYYSWDFANREFPHPIIISSLLILSLSYCARGGGTPVSAVPEAGVLDSTTAAPVTASPESPAEAEVQSCGNGTLEPDKGEQCDVTDLGGATCSTLSNGLQEGDLSCNLDCTYNVIGCYDVPVSSSGGDTGMAGSYGSP